MVLSVEGVETVLMKPFINKLNLRLLTHEKNTIEDGASYQRSSQWTEPVEGIRDGQLTWIPPRQSIHQLSRYCKQSTIRLVFRVNF